MLSKKTVVFLAALLALLLAANHLADRLLSGGGGPGGLAQPVLLPRADLASFSAATVSNGGAAVRVERTPGGRWR
ncbi:MAG: hypothetical protein II839_05260, partial [Kiritimatiellae bacterium]|nr:hypothetical protein [Kiritimatiellia bacterium]